MEANANPRCRGPGSMPITPKTGSFLHADSHAPCPFGKCEPIATQLSLRAADSRARALASTLRELMAAGFVSQPALANELNRRETPTRLGGKWHRTTVARVLARLGLVTNGRINNGLAHKRAAEVRAKALALTIRKLRRAGFVSSRVIARELNEREIPTARDGKWHTSTVKRLLRRLENVEARPPKYAVSQHRR